MTETEDIKQRGRKQQQQQQLQQRQQQQQQKQQQKQQQQQPTMFADVGKVIEVFFSRVFYMHGKLVGIYPLYFLIGSLLFTAICSFGFLNLTINLNLYKLFVPEDAPVRREFER